MICRKCESEMVPDYDYVNAVKVIVCANPSCLHREYPDYPRRSGNQELCYICGRLFTFGEKEVGIICRDCKKDIGRNKRSRRRQARRDSAQFSI